MRLAVMGAVALVCIGVIGLGVVESREDDELRAERQKASNYKYAKSWLALALPVAYCLLDAAGTFADTLVLDTLAGEAEAAGLFATAEECSSYAASVSNCAYELTFLFAAVCCIVYVGFIKNRSLHSARKDRNTSVQSARLLVSLLIFLHYLILHMLLFLRRSFPHTAWHLLSGAAFS